MTKHEKEMLSKIEEKAKELDILVKRIKVRSYDTYDRYRDIIIVKEDAPKICILQDYIDSIDDEFGYGHVKSIVQADHYGYNYE